MDPSPPASTDLHQLVSIIARRWQGLHIGDNPTDPAPWGYLVGVAAPLGSTRSPSLWPVWPQWHPQSPQAGFTVLPNHPATVLRGFIAPPTWQAVGVAVHGVARKVGTTSDGRAAVVWLCHRNGSTGSWLSLPGDDPIVTVSAPTNAPTPPDDGDRGVVASLLRRSLRRCCDNGPQTPAQS